MFDDLKGDATEVTILLRAIRRREEAEVMLKRLWPLVKGLREELEPLEKEYNRWAQQHYIAEHRIAELKKQSVPLGVSGRKKKKDPEKMSEKEVEGFLAKQTQSERSALIKRLEKIMGEGE